MFPDRCPVCDRPVPMGDFLICGNCEKGLKKIQSPFCLKCGKPLPAEEELCSDCRRMSHRFLQGRSLFVYGEMADSIYRFKYKGRQEYAAWYGKTMAEEFAGYVKTIRPDALIPVPMHEKRYRERGYNQAALLAEEIGKNLRVPVQDELILRKEGTADQKTLNRTQRQNNLKKAFKITANDVKLKTIILIDDVYTTGSTMDALAEVLTEAGVKQIFFLTLSTGSPL